MDFLSDPDEFDYGDYDGEEEGAEALRAYEADLLDENESWEERMEYAAAGNDYIEENEHLDVDPTDGSPTEQ